MKTNKLIDFIKEYGLLLLIIVGPLLGFIIMAVLAGPNTKVNVHWHMPISYDVCGDTTQIKDSGKHGKLHGHDDKQIHIEGAIDTENRTETLGTFFSSANIKFSDTQIGDFKNGDKCEGSDTPGKLSVEVNGKKISNFTDYILNDKDDIKIIFK